MAVDARLRNRRTGLTADFVSDSVRCLRNASYPPLLSVVRIENSNKSRHAAEFWMIEPDITDRLSDISDIAPLAEALLS